MQNSYMSSFIVYFTSCEGGREGGGEREGGREGGCRVGGKRESEGEREERKEGGKEGGRERRTEGGREGGREREEGKIVTPKHEYLSYYLQNFLWYHFFTVWCPANKKPDKLDSQVCRQSTEPRRLLVHSIPP